MRSAPWQAGAPPWFGGPFRQALGAGLAVAIAALVCGWPYWRAHHLAAAITLLSCGAFAVAGRLLTAGRLGRRTGALFLAASVAWAITWTASWNAGAGPVISVFAQSTFYFAVGLGVLLYPAGQLTRLAERLWAAAAALILFGGRLLLCVTSEPRWNGFASSVIWPSLLADPMVFHDALRALTSVSAALVGALVIILVMRLPRTGPMERSLGVLVTAAVAVVLVAALASQTTILKSDVRLTDVLGVYMVQGTSAIVLPLAFLTTRLKDRLAELTVAERILRLTGPVSVEKVRDALRRVLHDSTLELWFWIPEESIYVDVQGHRLEPSAERPQARWRHEVRTQNGAPLAAVEGAAGLRDHASLVEAALVAGGQALETAQLQATAQAHLERARTARERLVRVQTAERERLAGDLQDSAQHRLRTLETMLVHLESKTADPTVREQVRICRRELDQAVSELSDLARGIHPAILTSTGLGPALDLVAGRTPTPTVHIEIPAQRFPPEIESTLYFALCEALTNAVKHARATRIRLSVQLNEGKIIAEARDDGIGRAHPAAGTGGLTGMIDRIGALRGHVEIDTRPEIGTTVRICLPAEEP